MDQHLSEVSKLGVAGLAILLCIAVVRGVFKVRESAAKKRNAGPDNRLSSGRLTVARLEADRAPMPHHWKKEVSDIGFEAALEVASTLEQRSVPMPGHWHRQVEAEARHQANNAVTALTTDVSILKSSVSNLRDTIMPLHAKTIHNETLLEEMKKGQDRIERDVIALRDTVSKGQRELLEAVISVMKK